MHRIPLHELGSLARDYAELAEFDPARDVYLDDEELISQIENHLRFRRMFDFLSSDPVHIADVMARGGVATAMHELGIEATADEWAEFERRQVVASHTVDIKRLLTGRSLDESEEGFDNVARVATGDLYSGIWQDQLDGGLLKVAVTDVSRVPTTEIAELMPDGSIDFRLIEQEYSRDQLAAWKQLINDRMHDAGFSGGTGFRYDNAGVKIRVFAGTEDGDVRPFLSDIPDGAYVVASGFVGRPMSDPTVTHSLSDQQSGLQIGIWTSSNSFWGRCTWGVAGHTSAYEYIVTAGHCFTGEGTVLSGWGYRYVRQNGTIYGHTVSTPSSAFVYARYLDGAADFDQARISSPYADTNCYHGNVTDCAYHITSRISLYAHAVGQTVCATLGTSEVYDCGVVTDDDLDGTWDYNGAGSPYPYGVDNRIVVDGIDGDYGDSGSGAMYGGNFHGIITNALFDFYDNPIGVVAFVPAYYVKANIGATSFDYNCVKSGATWGACPISYTN